MEPPVPDPHQLTDLQLAVLRVLWDTREATAAEITEALRPERGLAQTTISTILSRLEKRGIVDHEAPGRQFVYRAKVTESEVRHSMVRELTEQLFDGDATALVSHLLSEREIDRGDLARVKELIQAHEKEARRASR
jgi:predicted transcriptional regulator